MNIQSDIRLRSEARRVRWWQILSWQLYDFADTIYSMNVTSRYFGPWMIAAFGSSELVFNLLMALGNLVVAVVSPLFGALSDAQGRRLPYLRFFAIVCALATALIGFSPSLPWAAVLFLISYVAYSAAGNNFYQALLPGLSTPANVSRISGIGVALGYLGAAVGLYAVKPFVPAEAAMGGKSFLPTAVLFFLFAIPCLGWVPDITDSVQRVRLDLGAGYRRVAATFAAARQHRHLFRFLVADFLYENAVAGVIFNMTVYLQRVAGFSGGEVDAVLASSILVAVVFAAGYGWLTDRIGPKSAVLGMLTIWCLVFPLLMFTRDKSVFYYIIGPLAGMGLGSTWVSSRTFLVALAPVERSGEFFGLYSLSGKSAGVAGLGAWALVLWLTQDRLGPVAAQQAAAGCMLLFVLAGAALILPLPDVRPTRANCICE